MTTISLILASESVRFPKVKLAEPAPSEYAHIAAEVDERALFLPNSWRKRQLIENCRLWCRRLATNLTLGERRRLPAGVPRYRSRRVHCHRRWSRFVFLARQELPSSREEHT